MTIYNPVVATVKIKRPLESGSMHLASRVFSSKASIRKILIWAHSVGIKNPIISDVIFSTYEGTSNE